MSTTAYIYNESAAGTINGVNITFTVVHPISSIESLRIGYVDYTNFTFSGNTITLNDAPTVISGGVFVDYFYESGAPSYDVVNLIYGEDLAGEVNGINKVFTSVFTIGHIDELRVDGVVYTSFTVNGRYVTLATAPSVGMDVNIDYYRKDVDVNAIESGITLSELRNSIYLRLGQTITSLQFPKELADEYISEGVTRVSKMKRSKIKRGVFTFHKAMDSHVKSTDGSIIDVGTTSVFTPEKGAALISHGNLITYASKTSTSIDSVYGLELNIVEGERIQYGYKLSKKIEKVSEVFIDGFKLTPADFAEYRSTVDTDKFCVHNGFLFLPYTATDGLVATVVYISRPSSEYEDSDIIDFDGDYMPVIKSFVLVNMYRDREDDRYRLENDNYKQLLKEYKRELSKQYETSSTKMQTVSPLNRF